MRTSARQETESQDQEALRSPDIATASLADREDSHPILRLQRAIGNQAAQRVIRNAPAPSGAAGASQRELRVSSPADPSERRAEQAATQVMQSEAPGPDTRPGFTSSAGPGGAPLPGELRSHFEPRFGHDFAEVRVHTGDAAAEAAESVEARAYTVGSDIVFGSGAYEPSTGEGQKLLAHELAHVVQQSNEGPSIQRAPATGGTPAPVTEHLTGTLWATDSEGKSLPPSLDDISQGAVADCFLFAAMAAMVNTNPGNILSMIQDHGDGSYTVTFKGIGFWSSARQTVTADFVKGRHGNLTARKALWPLVIEAAYAKQKGGLDVLDKGGNAGTALDEMLNDGPSRFDPREKQADYILGKLAKAKEKKWPMTILAPKKDDATTDKKALALNTPGLHFWHTYAIVDIDALHNRIKLFNPWGNDHPNADGWVDVELVRKFFIEIDISD